MKTTKKALLLALCAVLLVVSTVFVTMAYLTSKTEVVTNTFTVGNVAITLDEAKVTEYGVKDGDTRVTANTYKLMPGHTYEKDPTVHVTAGSEDCWIFAKIENNLGNRATIAVNSGWVLVEDQTDVYAYTTKVSAGAEITVFEEFTTTATAVFTDVTETTAITVQAYAVQADGFATAADAWTAAPATWGN